MFKKIFGGVAIGASVAGVLAYLHHKKTITPYIKKVNEYQEIERNLTNNVQDIEKKYNEVKENNDAINKAYINLCTLHDRIIDSYDILINTDMLADIANIDDTGYRDECLEEIERATKELHNISISYICTDDYLEACKDRIHKITEKVTENIKKSIDDAENAFSDDDDEEDEDEITVSPKKLILNGVNGEVKIFDADPDVGFEVLDGSDPEDNDYCIVAQNIPALYNFLFDNIKLQLASHYVSKIDSESFDNLLEDMIITISFSFINDTDAEITAINAVVPFEVFNEIDENKNNKIYSIKNGELTHDNILHYFRSSGSNSNMEKRKPNISEPRNQSKTIEKKVVKSINTEEIDMSLSSTNIDFIVESIGFNRESLKSFMGKLEILLNANPEAGGAIYSVFKTIVIEIHEALAEDKLSDEYKSALIENLRALNSNMRKNYGSDIKRYS